MGLRNSWQAAWENDRLHISGITDLFPNDFSTAQLRLESDDTAAKARIYRLVFSRDKEPFCGKDLIGPVHHYERGLPQTIEQVRVLSPDGVEAGTCMIPRRPRANVR